MMGDANGFSYRVLKLREQPPLERETSFECIHLLSCRLIMS